MSFFHKFIYFGNNYLNLINAESTDCSTNIADSIEANITNSK